MAEKHDLNVTDASNTSRFPENQAPSTVNNGARALEGLVAREYYDMDGSVTATVSGSVIQLRANRNSLTLTGTSSNYFANLVMRFRMGTANQPTPCSINIETETAPTGIGPISLRDARGNSLTASHIAAGQLVTVWKDGTNDYFRLVEPSLLASDDFRITSNLFAALDNSGIVVGHTDKLTVGGVGSQLQMLGTGVSDSYQVIGAFSNGTFEPVLAFLKSRATTIGSVSASALSDGDNIGSIRGYVDDSNDYGHYAAAINIRADGAHGVNSVPGLISFWTTPDGSQSPLERMQITAAGELLIGHTAAITAGTVASSLQVHGTESGGDDSSLMLTRWATNAQDPALIFGKANAATIGTYTAAADADALGAIWWTAADGTDMASYCAGIRAVANTAHGANDTPADLLFSTTADGAAAVTERMRITAAGEVLVAASSAVTTGGRSAHLQHHTTSATDHGLQLGRFDGATVNGVGIDLVKSRNSTVGTATTKVESGDTIGWVYAYGADGTDLASEVAGITFAVDGATGANDTPGRIVFLTTADGAATATERMRITSAGLVGIGDTSNANMTVGLTINQGAADNEILALKSSDVAHGLASIAETDTFFTVHKTTSAQGGVLLSAINEDDTASSVFNLLSYGGTAPTSKNTVSTALTAITVYEHNGADALANITADGNVFAVRGYVGGAGTTLFIVDEDGDTFQDGTAGTAFDAFDDAALLRGLELARQDMHPGKVVLHPSRYDANRYDRKALEDAKLLGKVSPEEEASGGRPLVNTSQVSRLAVGAIWQNHEMLDALIDTLTASDPGFKGKLRNEFVRRGLPTAIIDWTGPVPGGPPADPPADPPVDPPVDPPADPPVDPPV